MHGALFAVAAAAVRLRPSVPAARRGLAVALPALLAAGRSARASCEPDAHSAPPPPPLAAPLAAPPSSAVAGATGLRGLGAMVSRNDWVLVGVSIGAAVLTATTASLLPGALGAFVDVVAAGTEPIALPAAQLVALVIGQCLMHAFSYSILTLATERVITELRFRVFDALVRQEIGFFDARGAGEMTERLGPDIQEIKVALRHVVTMGLKGFASIVANTGTLFALSPRLTSVLLLVLPVMVAVGSGYVYMLRDIQRRSAAEHARAASLADETLSNIRTVRAFGAEESEAERYHEALQSAQTLSSRLGIGIGILQTMTGFAMNGVIVLVSAYGAVLVRDGVMARGAIMSFLLSTLSLQQAMAQISILHGQLVRASAAAYRLMSLIDREPLIPVGRGDIGVRPDTSSVQGAIDFHGVVFRYPTRPGVEVLRGLDLSLEPGKVTALVAASGGGKSTVAGLIERFYEPEAGLVMMDGVDIRQLDPLWLRAQIGVVSQEPVLFASRTILENIQMGRPEATREEAMDAARQANAHEFISAFPDGYETTVGDRGTLLSGGQKQRIAIARAILRNPRILILDEATSALDTESERLVVDALARLMDGRTVLVIAHRLSTIQAADKIVVLSDGRVAEQGTHAALMKRKDSRYADLVRAQVAEE